MAVAARVLTPSSFSVCRLTDSALGYSACFLSALQAAARGSEYKLPEDTEVHADVSLGVPEGSTGFALAANLVVKGSFPEAEKKTVEELVQKAHENCPYSRATYVSLLTQSQQHAGQRVGGISLDSSIGKCTHFHRHVHDRLWPRPHAAREEDVCTASGCDSVVCKVNR